jgi:hypothetical protein
MTKIGTFNTTNPAQVDQALALLQEQQAAFLREQGQAASFPTTQPEAPAKGVNQFVPPPQTPEPSAQARLASSQTEVQDLANQLVPLYHEDQVRKANGRFHAGQSHILWRQLMGRFLSFQKILFQFRQNLANAEQAVQNLPPEALENLPSFNAAHEITAALLNDILIMRSLSQQGQIQKRLAERAFLQMHTELGLMSYHEGVTLYYDPEDIMQMILEGKLKLDRVS